MSLGRAALGFLLVSGVAAGQSTLAHIAAGGGWSTVITLVNRSATRTGANLSIYFSNDNGSDLILPVTTTLRGNSQTTTTGQVDAFLDWNETLLISIGDQIASTVVGSAEVSADISGFAIFRYTAPTGPASEGTVPLEARSPRATSVTLPYDNTAGFLMGVALAVRGVRSAITATVWDDRGNRLGTQTFTIAQGGHTSFALPEQIPLTAGKRGIVEFRVGPEVVPEVGELALFGLGLRFSPFGTFTSVPSVPPIE
jgi:hypothetical protein